MVSPNQAAPPHSRKAPPAGIHGFVGKKTEDPQALKLLIAASEYAAAAACRLTQNTSGAPSALPHLIGDYVDIVFGLEVHFVFPNLSAEKRDLLVAIMKVRNSISAVLNGALRRGSAGEKATLAQLTAGLELKFLELRSRIVESGIEAQLDPVQKKIFQDEFFSITLDKRCSTTLFFRTDAAPWPNSESGRFQHSEAAARTEPSFRQALHDGIPPFGPALQGFEPCTLMQGLDPRIMMQCQSAQPVIDEQRVPRQKTVLLISADSRAQELVGSALRQAGYKLLLANAGFSGYATAMRERPDLVLVDLSLSLEVSGPDAYLDGRGVLKMLSKLPSSRALPFIGLVSNDASEAQVLASGARACLQKPLDPRQVLEAVQKAWVELPLETETDEATRSPWTVSASV